MLVPSDRHRPKDLAVWHELEIADAVEAGRIDWPRLVDRSLDSIAAFVADDRAYLSVSWGKDSVATAHLCHQAATERGIAPVPVVNLRVYPTRNPDCDAVRDLFLARFPAPYHEELVDYSVVDPRLPSITWDRQTYALWDAAWRRVERRFGQRHISGIRASESFGRRKRMQRFGLNSPNACAPIGWWRLDDVFAYLAASDLPVHASYAMLGGGRWDRRRLRVSEIGDEKGCGCGRREWEIEYYGDALRRLVASRCPDSAG